MVRERNTLKEALKLVREALKAGGNREVVIKKIMTPKGTYYRVDDKLKVEVRLG